LKRANIKKEIPIFTVWVTTEDGNNTCFFSTCATLWEQAMSIRSIFFFLLLIFPSLLMGWFFILVTHKIFFYLAQFTVWKNFIFFFFK
jgi:hypothetical protein